MKPVFCGDFPEHAPVRMRGNILDNDGPAERRCAATRTDAGPNGNGTEFLEKLFQHAMPTRRHHQMRAFWIDSHDRTECLVHRKNFNAADDVIQDSRQRNSLEDHFQNLRLAA